MGLAGSIYGLGIRSDVPVAAFAGMAAPARVDVRWSLGRMPEGFEWISPDDWIAHGASSGDPEMQSQVRVFRAGRQGLYRFEYADGTRVVLDEAGANVWASWPAEATVEDTAAYLLGPVMGFVLRLRGIPCLHASAVAVEGRAIAFAGHAGSGKSTLAASCARRGYPVVTEDVLPLRFGSGEIFAASGYPLIRLWPASVAALFGSPDVLPRITPTWEKRHLALGGADAPFQCDALPLGAICVLTDRGADRTPVARLDAARALVWLVAHAYSTLLLDREMRAREFERLALVAEQVPVFRISPPATIGEIPRFCDAVLARVAARTAACASGHAPV